MDVQTLISTAGGVEELARRLGVARTTVLDWRRMRRVPGNRVPEIASEFKLTPADAVMLMVAPESSDAGDEPHQGAPA